jgi:hypothetical protein
VPKGIAADEPAPIKKKFNATDDPKINLGIGMID